MKSGFSALAVAVAFSFAGPLLAATGTASDAAKPAIAYFRIIDRLLKPVTLSDDQKSKLEGLKSDYEPKFKDLYGKRNVLTPEQEKQAADARKAARAAGKTGKDVTAAVDAAVKLSDEQENQKTAATKQLHALEKQFRGKVMDLLTAEQKSQIAAAKMKTPPKGGTTNTAPAEPEKSDAAKPVPAAPTR